MADIETITHIKVGDIIHPIETQTLNGKTADNFQIKNLVTEINASSTDTQYPSAKCVYDLMVNIETLLSKI